MKQQDKYNKHSRQISKLILTFIFILILSSFAYAQPPFQSSEGVSNELTIVYPKEDSFNINNDIKLHFHIFNSTGFILNVSDVDCRIHIYGHDGNHLIDEPLIDGTETAVTYDKEIYLTSDNFTGIGDYGFTIWCNSSQNEAGFYSSNLLLSNTDRTPELTDLILIFSLIGVIIGLLYISFNLADVHVLFKVLTQFFALYFLYYLPTISLSVINTTSQKFFYLFNAYLYLFWLYVFGYVSYITLDYFGKLTKFKMKFKKRK